MSRIPNQLQHGTGALMTLEPGLVLVSLKTPHKPEALAPAIGRAGLTVTASAPAPNARIARSAKAPSTINNTSTKVWATAPAAMTLGANPAQDIDTIARTLGGDVDYVAPVYRIANTPGPGGLVSPLPDALLISRNGRFATDSGRLQAAGLREVPEKSKVLRGFRYYAIDHPQQRNAYEIKEQLEQQGFTGIKFETMPMVRPTALDPADPLYGAQWNMKKIHAGGPGTTGWNISEGTASVVVCILDEGCDLAHPDLNFFNNGINLGTMSGTGAPTGSHGTACAGIAAGIINSIGVAGVAGKCRVLPVAFQNWTDAEVAAGITWAADNGAHVISMSFGVYAPGEGVGPTGWDFSVIDPSIDYAIGKGLVLCAATGNEDLSSHNRYPSRNPKVIACGASNQADVRKSKASGSSDPNDGEYWWGSNYADGVSVVAPGIHITTTDRLGAAGYEPGDYDATFNGTSSATPHVAGLAALLRSAYPSLTNLQVRNAIERTAEKVGGYAYATNPAYPNGTRHPEMGYGRINVYAALDSADLVIKDWSGDDGTEPSSAPSGNFWDYSDIVVRPSDDNVFNPNDLAGSRNVEKGQTNYIYVRVTNNGPATARNVVVNCRVRPWVGTQFVYPADWTAIDSSHVAPAVVANTFASVPAGTSVIAKFTLSSAQVDQLFNWISTLGHPCMVASANCDNDYSFASADLTLSPPSARRNNLAQRNLSVVDVIAGATASFHFLAANALNLDPQLTLVVNRGTFPRDSRMTIAVDEPAQAFPQLRDLIVPVQPQGVFSRDSVRFLDRGRLSTLLGGQPSVLTLEAGSQLSPAAVSAIRNVSVTGGDVILRDQKREVLMNNDVATIKIDRTPGAVHPVDVRTEIPARAKKGDQFTVSIAQKDARGVVVGGATVVYRVK